jgi:hypothetical protein
MLDWLLLMRLTVFNVTGLCGVFWAYKQGYTKALLAGDHSGVSLAIVAVFLYFLGYSMWRGYKVSKLINEYKYRVGLVSGGRHLRTHADGERARQADKLEHKQAIIGDAADWLVYMGLIGTAIGMLAIFAGGKSELDQASLISGMLILLPATIVGLLGALWTSINYRMLESAVQAYRVDVRQ